MHPHAPSAEIHIKYTQKTVNRCIPKNMTIDTLVALISDSKKLFPKKLSFNSSNNYLSSHMYMKISQTPKHKFHHT